MRICEYGCGREARYPPRKGKTKWSCEYNHQNCPSNYTSRSINEVKSFIEKKGYEWISGEYKNEMSILNLCCKNGHDYITNFNNLNTGGRCPECNNINYWNIEKVKQFTKQYGVKCISEIYDYVEKLDFICPKNHIFEMRWDTFYCGARCPICKDINRSINFTGEGNPNWKGGISNEPYCSLWSISEFKESIKIRDGFSCLNPYCHRKSDVLVIHHIDYNKKNCDQRNLITICNSCNSMANYDREWHTEWYKAILYRRYKFT